MAQAFSKGALTSMSYNERHFISISGSMILYNLKQHETNWNQFKSILGQLVANLKHLEADLTQKKNA